MNYSLSFCNLTDSNYDVKNIYVKILQNLSCGDLRSQKKDLNQK